MSISTTEYADGTSVTMNYPWGTYVSAKVLCADGIVRTARNIKEPDTFFSVPCNVEVQGKPIKGYFTFDTREGFSTETDDDPMVCKFRHYTYANHRGLLPEWPKLGG